LKKCKDCGELKSIELFYKSQGECKECTKSRVRDNYNRVGNTYDRTEKGVIRVIYKTQKRNSKIRGHDGPSYSKQELSEWLYNNGFKNLYYIWVDSGYKKDLKPSVDRIDDFKPYTLDNITLGTWFDNRTKQYSDIKNGAGTSGKRCKAVGQYDKDMNLINIFHSQHEAERQTGISHKYISMCCRGVVPHAKGFIFKRAYWSWFLFFTR
jgi:hypothetical protein